MPAITLRSSQNTLRSPFNHDAYQAAIRLRSCAITLCSIPLIPWADRSPAFGLGGRAWRDPEVREGGKDLVSLDNAVTPRRRLPIDLTTLKDSSAKALGADRAGIATGYGLTRLAWSRITVIAAAFADTAPTRPAATRSNAGFAGLSRRRPHDGKSRGRVFHARVAAASFTLVDGKTRPRGLAKRLPWRNGHSLWRSRQKDPAGCRVGSNQPHHRVIDLPSLARALPENPVADRPQNFGGAGSENSGRPVPENLCGGAT